MDPNVVVVRLAPVDVLRRNDEHTLTILHHEPFGRYARTQEIIQPVVAPPGAITQPGHRLAQALAVEGLEEVIDGVQIERLYGESVVGGHEDDLRSFRRRQGAYDVHAGQPRHGDVEK